MENKLMRGKWRERVTDIKNMTQLEIMRNGHRKKSYTDRKNTRQGSKYDN